MKVILLLGPALLVPTLLAAQHAPNEHASDIAKARVAANIAKHLAKHPTRVVGEAVIPATRATPATPATPATHADGGPTTRATPATPATPAVPASASHRPDHAGLGGQGRGNNARRP